MANQPKKYKKFVATAATATLVASAIVPVASAAHTDTTGHQFESYINEATELGLFKDGGEFKPQNKLTRKHVVLILGRYLEEAGKKPAADYATNPAFTDLGTSDAEYIRLASVVKEAGIFSGDNGKINGGDNISRQHMAKVLNGLAEAVTGTSLVEAAKDIEDAKVTDLAAAGASYRDAIQALADFGITTVEKFNPKGDVTRGQFAKFIMETIGAVKKIEEGVKPTPPTTEELEAAAKAVEEAVKALPAVASINKDNAADAKAKADAVTAAVAKAEELLKNADLTDAEKEEAKKALDAAKAAAKAVTDQVAEVTKPVVGLAVESVSAINANEIQVTFSRAVNPSTAVSSTITDLDKAYVITINNDKYGDTSAVGSYTSLAALVSEATISKDNKTVTFKLIDTAGSSKALKHGDKYSVDVKDSVLSLDGNDKVERYADTQKIFDDLKAPTLKETKLEGTKLALTFDEPLLISTGTNPFSITVDGVVVPATAITAPTKPLDYTYVIDLAHANMTAAATAAGANVTKLGTHNVTIYNARDHVANNANVGNRAPIITTTYNVDGTQTQPAVKEIEALDFNSFKVKFDKPVSNTAKIKVTKGGTTFFDSAAAAAAATVTWNATGTEATVNLPLSTVSFTGSGLTYLYDTNATATNISVQVTDYQNPTTLLYGNNYNGSLSLKLDAKKPTVASAKLNATAGLDVQLNRVDELTTAITLDTTVDKSKVKVTDKNGLVRTVDTIAVNATTGVVTVTLVDFAATASATTSAYADYAPFKVEFAKDTVAFNTDKVDIASDKLVAGDGLFTVGSFYSKLKNDAFTAIVGSTTSAYKAIEGVTSALAHGTDPNKIVVTYLKEMSASATDVNNYTLDGKALPAGTTVTINGTAKVVTITLPEGTFKNNESRALGISTAVKTKDDEAIVGNIGSKEAYQSGLIAFTDNTKPVLQSAKFGTVTATNTTTTIELTFSEAITAVDNDDFVVIAHDGTKIAVTAAVASPVSDKVTLTLATAVNVSQTVKVQVVPVGDTNTVISTVDGTGNKAVEGTIVNVTR